MNMLYEIKSAIERIRLLVGEEAFVGITLDADQHGCGILGNKWAKPVKFEWTVHVGSHRGDKMSVHENVIGPELAPLVEFVLSKLRKEVAA